MLSKTLFALLASVGLAACSSSPSVFGATWQQATVLEQKTKLGGCVVADLDPLRDGNEIAITAGSGALHCVYRDGDGWGHEVIAVLPGEMIQCAAGDLDPTHPGDELVVVGIAEGGEDDGGPGAAYLAWRTAEGWQHSKIFEDEALLHAVCVDDSVPNGAALYLAGYARQVYRLTWNGGGQFASERVGELPGDAKGAAALPGRGVVVASADGSVTQFQRENGAWTQASLGHYDAPLARIATEGDAVLVSANDGVLRRIEGGNTLDLYASTDRLRGAVFGDFEPNRPGREVATAGYDGQVTVLAQDGGGPLQVGNDTDKLHHLAAGELPGIGLALVTCGYSGRVLVCWSERNP